MPVNNQAYLKFSSNQHFVTAYTQWTPGDLLQHVDQKHYAYEYLGLREFVLDIPAA